MTEQPLTTEERERFDEIINNSWSATIAHNEHNSTRQTIREYIAAGHDGTGIDEAVRRPTAGA